MVGEGKEEEEASRTLLSASVYMPISLLYGLERAFGYVCPLSLSASSSSLPSLAIPSPQK